MQFTVTEAVQVGKDGGGRMMELMRKLPPPIQSWLTAYVKPVPDWKIVVSEVVSRRRRYPENRHVTYPDVESILDLAGGGIARGESVESFVNRLSDAFQVIEGRKK